MIDLDAPEAGPRETAAGRRWRGPAAVVALLAVGALLGGAVGYRWQAQRTDAAERPAVVLFVPPVVGLKDDTSTSMSDYVTGTSVEIPAFVGMANVSDAPLTVLSLSVQQPGVTLSSTLDAGSKRSLGSGQASFVKVALRVHCATGYPVGAVRAVVSVETDDGGRRTRTLSATFDGSSWNQRLDSGCRPSQ